MVLGGEFLRAARALLAGIGRAPLQCPVARGAVRRARVWRFPCVVYFLAELTRVVVVGVLHGRRNPHLCAMLSNHLSRASALLLGVAGFAFVFAAREMLALLAPGTPRSAAWIGHLLGAALVGLGCLNWFNRHALLGGIHARAVVLANTMFYLIGALSIFGGSASLPGTRPIAQGVASVLGVFAACYAWLLLRGPLERDIATYRRH